MRTPREIAEEEHKEAILRGDITPLENGDFLITKDYRIKMLQEMVAMQHEVIDYMKKDIKQLKQHLKNFTCTPN